MSTRLRAFLWLLAEARWWLAGLRPDVWDSEVGMLGNPWEDGEK